VAEGQALEAEVREYLRQCVGDARRFHERHRVLKARWRTNIDARRAIDPADGFTAGATVQAFEAFVRARVHRFDRDGHSGNGAAWAREDRR
jgi:hypothetical protein